jgi:hypothetical protein
MRRDARAAVLGDAGWHIWTCRESRYQGSVVRLMCAGWRDLAGGVGWMAGLRVILDGIPIWDVVFWPSFTSGWGMMFQVNLRV